MFISCDWALVNMWQYVSWQCFISKIIAFFRTDLDWTIFLPDFTMKSFQIRDQEKIRVFCYIDQILPLDFMCLGYWKSITTWSRIEYVCFSMQVLILDIDWKCSTCINSDQFSGKKENHSKWIFWRQLCCPIRFLLFHFDFRFDLICL